MAPNQSGDSSSWLTTNTFAPNVRITRGSPFTVDKGLLASKSAKVASLLENNPYEDLSMLFKEVKTNAETIELVSRFCHGLQVTLTSKNIISLICLAHHLKMTESHSPNNLLNISITFFQDHILPSWDLTIQSLRSPPCSILQQAADIGLLGYCLDSLVGLVLPDPTLLARPIDVDFYPNKSNSRLMVTHDVRRKLLDFRSCNDEVMPPFEDLTSLPLGVYKLVMDTMVKSRVPPENIAGSLFKYFKMHTSSSHGGDDVSYQRQVVEVIERLLPTSPNSKGFLFEVYNVAVSSGVGSECLNGLEDRIGKLMDRVTVNDLVNLDPNTDSLRRILKGYYGNFDNHDDSGLVAVAELMEGYLAEVAKEGELDTKMFLEIADMASSTMSIGESRCLDGIYHAVVIYLERNVSRLSENEREEICRVIDFSRMSKHACNHATQNHLLPLRVVVQALFISQLQLRDDVIRVVGRSTCNNNSSIVINGGEEEGKKLSNGGGDDDEEEWEEERRELIEHERSCCEKKEKGKKVSLWKEVKRKLGCMGSNSFETFHHQCNNCQIKKRKNVHIK